MASDQNAFLDSETVAAPHEGPRQSLAELAYERLKRKILTLEFAPGAYLNEAAIAKSIEIGRNPVHHAVKQLVFEGMLEIMPRKGLFVKPLDLAEMLNVAEARLLNEVSAVFNPGEMTALLGPSVGRCRLLKSASTRAMPHTWAPPRAQLSNA